MKRTQKQLHRLACAVAMALTNQKLELTPEKAELMRQCLTEMLELTGVKAPAPVAN